MGCNLVQRKTYSAELCQVICAGVTGLFHSRVAESIQEACGQDSETRQHSLHHPGEHLGGSAGLLCPSHAGALLCRVSGKAGL